MLLEPISHRIDIARGEKQVDKWKTRFQTVERGLDKAAGYQYGRIRPVFLDTGKILQSAGDTVFSALSYHAGIEDNDVGLSKITARFESDGLKTGGNII
jgi:hypothetical protein